MALIKSMQTSKNVTVEYHKIATYPMQASPQNDGSVLITVYVEKWVNKATRLDGSFNAVQVDPYQIVLPDLRPDISNFEGLYSLLKTLPDFEGATDDL